MDALEEQIQKVLNDPEQLQQITRMAQAFMGTPPLERNGTLNNSTEKEVYPEIKDFLGAFQKGERGNCRTLMNAIKPYLSKGRQEKVEKALKFAQLAGMAELVMKKVVNENDTLSGE